MFCSLVHPDTLLAQGGPPIITSFPGNQTVGMGSTLTLTVTVSSSTAVSYQWFKDGASLANGVRISGATSANLVLSNVQTNDAGSYTVLAGNSSGSAFSSSAAINVVPTSTPPPNDNFANRIGLSGANIVISGSNVNATKEAGEPSLAFSSGGKSVWWSWTAPGDGRVSISTVGSSFDTIIGIYSGSFLNSLTLLAGDDDSGGSLTSLVSFNATNGTTYQIAVDGFGGIAGNLKLNIKLRPTTTLVSGLSNPQGIAVDDTNVYWIEYGSGTVKKIAKGGGPVGTLASGLFSPSGLALDNSFVYFAENVGSPASNIKKVSKGGGAVTTLVSGQPSTSKVAVDRTSVYWTDFNSGAVRKVGINGGTVSTLATASSFASGIAVDGTSVYWTEFNNPGPVRKVSLNGGTVTELATSSNTPGLATDGNYVYWTEFVFTGNGKVNKISVNGGTVTSLAAGLNSPWDVAVDGNNAYWVEYNTNGAIKQVALNGGAVTTLASSLNNPVGIAIDSTTVYWIEIGALKSVAIATNTSPPPPSGFVTRQLPTGYRPGAKFTVAIAAIPPSTTTVYAVEDTPPTGWTVGIINNDGIFDAGTGKVKFGLYFDSIERLLTYELTPPLGATGIFNFSGDGSADGSNNPVGGPNSIDRISDPTFILSAPSIGGVGFQIQLTGPAGLYDLQASTNLVAWTTLLTTTNPGTGPLPLTDPNARQFNRRFYRMIFR